MPVGPLPSRWKPMQSGELSLMTDFSTQLTARVHQLTINCVVCAAIAVTFTFRVEEVRGMGQGGAVARSMSSENQVWLGQYGTTNRTCSSPSLTFHRGCKTLPSYRLEGPAGPHPSPGGLRSLSVRQGHRCFAQR